MSIDYRAILEEVIAARGASPNLDARLDTLGAPGAQEVFVQPLPPSSPGPFLWIQTGLAPNGNGFTFWFEDGV